MRTKGIPVNHVLLLAPGQIGNMIDGLGGIAVSAPKAVTLLDTSGRSFGIRPGQIRLKGALADAYLFGQEQGDPTASPEQRQLDGLAAVGAAVLEPSSATLRTPNHLGGVIAKNTATDLTATTYLDELHAWGDVRRTVSCGAVDSSADATSMLAVLAGKGAASATPATCSTASVRPSGWFRRLGLLGSDPAAVLVLVGGLALLGAGICLLVLELSSPGFRTLRDRRRRAEAEAGPPQTAAPLAVSAPSVSPPPARATPAAPAPSLATERSTRAEVAPVAVRSWQATARASRLVDAAAHRSHPADSLSVSGGFGDTTTWWVDAAAWRAMLPCSRWPSARDS